MPESYLLTKLIGRAVFLTLLLTVLLSACDRNATADLNAFPAEDPAEVVESPDVDFQDGSGQALHRDAEHGLFAFSTDLGSETYVVVLNESEEAHSVRVPKPRSGHYELAFATRPDEPYRVQTDETGLIVEISARSGLLIRRIDE